MNYYDSVKLLIVKLLNSTILNNAFKKLYSNDNEIIPSSDYTPNVWENKWFNDEVIPGYSKGYCVWRNAYTDISAFLSSYGDVVYSYALKNDLLNTYLLSSWTQLSTEYKDNLPVLDIWRHRYYNVISGYSKETSSWYEEGKKKTKIEQLLPPLFDYGPYSGPISSRIELYISTCDDNKELLSNRTAWNNVILSSQTEYENFIKTEVDMLFSLHLKNYHLNCSLTPDEINTILLANNLSNFSIDNVLNTIQVKDHDSFMNTDGFDYVVDYKRFSSSDGNTLSTGKNFYLYRWYRLWNSGFLEHGGIIRCNLISTTVDNANLSDYIVKVDLNWNLGDKTNQIYNYDETSGNCFGETHSRFYYGDRNGNCNYPVYENIDPTEKYLNGKHYHVRITPTILLSSDVNLDNYHYNDVSELVNHDYISSVVLNKVSSYMTTEVHHLKNDSFCFTRSDTEKLDASAILYYLYYTSGFKKIITVNYDFGHVTITGIESKYLKTGKLIKPIPVVTNNIGDVLLRYKDYNVQYYAPGGTSPDFINGPIVNVLITGIKPYIGALTLQYKIVESL